MNGYFEYKGAVLDSDLTCEQKMVALVIASHFNWADLNPAFPGLKRIADKASVSVSTVTRAKKALIDGGWLKATRRYDATNLYVPAIPDVAHTEQLPQTYGHTDHAPETEEGPMVTVTNTYGQPDHTLWSEGPPNSEVNSEVKNEDYEPAQSAGAEGVIATSLAIESDDSLALTVSESSLASTTEAGRLAREDIIEGDGEVIEWDIDGGTPDISKPVDAPVRNTTVQATPAIAEAVRKEPAGAPAYSAILSRAREIGKEQGWGIGEINDTIGEASRLSKRGWEGSLDDLIHKAYTEKW